MVNRQLITAGAVALAALVSTAAPARADWLLTPFLGISFGGDTTNEHLTYGGSIGWMGAGVIGVELDAANAPDLLKPEGDLDFANTDSNVATIMGNVIVGAPLGSPGVRPYVSGGAGLLRTSVNDAGELFDISDNSFGVNLGGGIMAFTSRNVGLRLDVRYFRSLQDSDAGSDIDLDLGDFHFWRATAGATFRF